MEDQEFLAFLKDSKKLGTKVLTREEFRRDIFPLIIKECERVFNPTEEDIKRLEEGRKHFQNWDTTWEIVSQE